MLSREDLIELQRLRCDHAALCFQVALIKYGLQLRYDDNQPRVPAGHVGAGRWTSDTAHEASPPAAREDAQRRDADPPASPPPQQDEWRITHVNHRPDGSIERQIVVTPDGDTISSVFARPGEQRFDERHRVQLADGTVRIFETTQGVQKIYDGDGALLSATRWTDKWPEAVETVQQASSARRDLLELAKAVTLRAGSTLYNALKATAGTGEKAVFVYPARIYESAKDQPLPLFVSRIRQEDAITICERAKTVQRLTDAAVAETNRAAYESAAAYGSAIHKKVKDEIEKLKDSDFRAEISYLKTFDETGQQPSEDGVDYGTRGSIRIDALQNIRATRTACVIDIKTGDARLYPARSFEMALAVKKNFDGVSWIIVMEVKPSIK